MTTFIALAVSALVIGLSMTQAEAKEIIECQSAGAPPIAIALNARTDFGRSLSCIQGDFISDMTPCAPTGGFGLSAPTGDARLVGVVMHWQDYSKRLGGVTAFYANDAKYQFIGGFNSPFSGFAENWRFDVSRITGDGTLKVKSRPSAAYLCRKAATKF